MQTLKITCKNCSQQFRGNYCNNCGQPANTSRIDLKYFLINIQLVFLSFDKGALFTIKELFKRPGHSIRDFIEGKRIKYFRPVSLLILLATLYTLISKNIEIPLIVKNTNNIADSESQKILAGKITQFIKIMIHNYGIFLLLFQPLISICTYLTFRKSKYNYVEHIILNTYISCQNLLIQLIVYLPLLYFFRTTSYIQLIIFLLTTTTLIWTYTQFFNKLSKIETILKLFLSYVILSFLVLLLTIIGMIIYIVTR